MKAFGNLSFPSKTDSLGLSKLIASTSQSKLSGLLAISLILLSGRPMRGYGYWLACIKRNSSHLLHYFIFSIHLLQCLF